MDNARPRPMEVQPEDEILPLTIRPVLRMKLIASFLILPFLRFIYDSGQVSTMLKLIRMTNGTFSETITAAVSGGGAMEQMKWICVTSTGLDCGVGKVLISVKAIQMAMNIYQLALALKMLRFDVSLNTQAAFYVDTSFAIGMCWNFLQQFGAGRARPAHMMPSRFQLLTVEFLSYCLEGGSLFVLFMLVASVGLERYPAMVGRHPREQLYQIRLVDSHHLINFLQIMVNWIADMAIDLIDFVVFGF